MGGFYLVFFTLIATEHVFEHSYAANILGFDETNLIDQSLPDVRLHISHLLSENGDTRP